MSATRIIRHAASGLVACAVAAASAALTSPARAQQPARALGIDTTNFDRSVRPQDDFFEFVNGGWLKRTEIPADRSSWGAFLELRERSAIALHGILESAARTPAAPGSNERKIGDFYASYMDSARVESLGLTPLRPELRVIDAVTTPAHLPEAFAHFARLGVAGPAGVFVGQDARNSDAYIVSVSQSGLGLPDR
ncbi:MAG TPA: M13 family metallopeptidase N-terminal domain-containing protein, partial [Gemmatirosa sp.]